MNYPQHSELYIDKSVTAISIDKLLVKCVELVRRHHMNDIEIKKLYDGIYVEENLERVTAQILQCIDMFCTLHKECFIRLELAEKGTVASVIFSTDKAPHEERLTYKLYTGAPGNVVYDSETEELYEEIVRKILSLPNLYIMGE